MNGKTLISWSLTQFKNEILTFQMLLKTGAGQSVLAANTESLESLLQFLIHDMRINYGGGDLGVPQSLLGQARVFGLPKQVRGECVPEHMGVDVLGDPRLRCQPFHHVSEISTQDQFAFAVGKYQLTFG